MNVTSLIPRNADPIKTMSDHTKSSMNVIPLIPRRNADTTGTRLQPVHSRGTANSAPGRDRNGGQSTIRPRITVCIVDDQFTGRKILEELVRSLDPELAITSFADPFEALRCAGRQAPDLILTDYRMPVLNGIEFTRRLREMPACVDVPLIMVTVVEDPDVRYRALDAGATDFLLRPIDQHECRARCRNLLTLRRQQKIIANRAHRLEEQVSIATRQIRNRERETLLRLARAGEYRDETTGYHVLRMAKYTRLIAEQLGLKAPECDELELAAPMHDIGKVGIPDDILLKPSALTPSEWDIMKTHSVIGYEILKDSASRYIQQGAVIALGHHERYDGSGYPHGLHSESIPFVARIVAVADVYDALTSRRPYKPAWTSEAAVCYVREQAGQHFDPRCVDALLAQLAAIEAVPQDGSTIEQ